MAIAIGAATYFAIQLGLGIVAGKLLRQRSKQEPATHTTIFVGRSVNVRLARPEHPDLVA